MSNQLIRRQYSSKNTEVLLFRSVCRKYGAEVFSRVPAGDLIDADALAAGSCGLKKRQLHHALSVRFDNVVSREDGTPVFAVDFGDAGGRRAARAKRALCRHAALPYLHVRSAYLRPRKRRCMLLSWCMELWFEHEEYRYWQAEGVLPQDKPMNIFDALADEPAAAWPVALFQELSDELQRLRGKAAMCELRAEFRIGVDGSGTHRGIAMVRAGDGTGLAVRAKLRAENADGMPVDLLKAILICHLLRKLRRRGLRSTGTLADCERWFDRRCTALANGVFGWGL